MMARAYLPKLGYAARHHLMNEMVPGLTGEKMSASEPDSKIDVLDSCESIRAKLEFAKCELGNIETNGPLHFSKVILQCLSFTDRKMKVGKFEFSQHEDLVHKFASKEVTPEELKHAVWKSLDALMAPVRDSFAAGSDLDKLAKDAYPDHRERSDQSTSASTSAPASASASAPAAPAAPIKVSPLDRLRCELALSQSSTVDATTVTKAPADTCVVAGKPALVSLDGVEVVVGASAIVALALAGEASAEASSWIEWTQLNAGSITASSVTPNDKAGHRALADLESALKSGSTLGCSGDELQAVQVELFCVLLAGFGMSSSAFDSGTFPAIQSWFDSVVASHGALYTAVLAHSLAAPAAPVAAVKAAPQVAFKGDVRALLLALFGDALKATFPDHMSNQEFKTQVGKAQAPKKGQARGEYQFNSSMSIFRELKQLGNTDFKAPKDVAAAIVANMAQHASIEKLEVAPQGFVNIKLAHAWVAEQLTKHVIPSGICHGEIQTTRQCLVDFSSPNIAKEMHVGHLRSTIIGESICRFLEFAGHDVKRINHVGDWGTQFGMLITHLMDNFPDFLTNRPPIGDLQKFYKESKIRFDAEEEFKTRSHEAVVRLQRGAEVERVTGEQCPEVQGWKLLCDISREEFKKIYDRLNVTLYEKGESFYNPLLPKTVDDLLALGVAEEEVTERGTCVLCKLEGSEQPLIARKSDGGYGYDSTDLAAIRYRVDEEKCDWLIYVTDSGQSSHFQLIFKAGRKAGWVPESVRLDHIGFGVVLSPEGGKFKTRSGQTVRLVDLLDEAMTRSKQVIEDKNASAKLLSDEDVLAASPVMGYGAVKYADLANRLDKDYTFDFDAMLNFTGNTAVYLMYAYARIQSIFGKTGVVGEAREQLIKSGTPAAMKENEEWEIAVQLLVCGEVLANVYETLHPHHMCTFLYELAEKINAFCGSKKPGCRVLGSENQAEKLILLHMAGQTLKIGMDLVGLGVVERL